MTAATLTGAVAAAASLSPSTDMAAVERDDRACRFAVVTSWSPMWEIYSTDYHIPHIYANECSGNYTCSTRAKVKVQTLTATELR